MIQIHVKDAAVTAILEEIASAYADLYPQEYEEFIACCREEEQTLLKPTGMSTDGTMMTFCKIPSTIYSFIKHQMRKRCGIPDFFKEESNYRLVTKIWSTCAIRHKRTARLEVHK